MHAWERAWAQWVACRTNGIEDVPSRRKKKIGCLAQKQFDEVDPRPDQIRGVGQDTGLIQRVAGPGQTHGLVIPSHHGLVQAPRPKANTPSLGLGEPILRAFGEFLGLAQCPTSVQHTCPTKAKIPTLSKATCKEGNRVEEREEGEIRDSADVH